MVIPAHGSGELRHARQPWNQRGFICGSIEPTNRLRSWLCSTLLSLVWGSAQAKVYGLHHHPGDPNDAVNLAANETRELQFVAGEPGGLVIPSRKKRGTARKLRGRASGKRQEEAQWKTSPSSLQHRK